MLRARGLNPTTSGIMISISYLGQMAAGLLAPIVAGRQRDQRLIIVVVVALTAAGLLGFVFAPVWSLTTCSIVLGLGQGGAFGVALLLFACGRATRNGAQLSALAQRVGYVVGGLVEPFAVGVIYDWSASWEVVEIFYVAVGAASLVFGLGAGRAFTVEVEPGA